MSLRPLVALLALPLLLYAGACASDQSESKKAKVQPPAATPPQANARMQQVLDAHASLNPKPIEALEPAEARKQPSPTDAVKALLQQEGKPVDPEPVGDVRDQRLAIPGAQPIPVRIYKPAGTAPQGGWPILLMIHGGGWVIATNDTYDSSNRALCNAAQCVVVSPEYRKGPENKFPAAHDDVWAVYKWLTTEQNVAGLGANAKKVAVGGESAGGNMAANVALRARDEKVQPPVHQLLIYPVASVDPEDESARRNANAKPLNTPMLAWFGKHYFNSPADAQDPRITLVSVKNLKGLAPATVITAEIDPLTTGGQRYADLLKSAGNDVRVRHFDGVTHEFFGMGAVLPEAKDAVAFAADGLKQSFAKSAGPR